MSLKEIKLSEKKGGFEIPDDTYLGKLYSIVDIGEQKFTYLGEERITPQVTITFELQDLKLGDGRPAAISKTYTASFNEKSNLFSTTRTLLGTEFDKVVLDEAITLDVVLKKILGKSALLTIEKSKNGKYSNITNIAQLPKAMANAVTEIANPLVFVDDVNSATDEQLKNVPEWLLNRMDNRVNKLESSDTEHPY